jgi:phosphatidylglycerol:prolipoprotein diacylglycerol transferase
MITTLFAWLYWNPNRTLFTIPIIDRPVVWYGLWFVFGFIVGYISLVPMFRKHLIETKTISSRDILKWPLFIQLVLEKTHKIKDFIPKKVRQVLTNNDHSKLNVETQSLLLDSVNLTIQEKEPSLDRDGIAMLFPKAVATTQELAQMLVDRLTWYCVAGTIIGARLGHVFFYEWPRYQKMPLEIFQVWKGGLASHGAAIGILLALYLYKKRIQKNFPEFSFLNLVDMVVVPTAFAGCCIRIGNFFNQEILGTPSTLPWAVIFGDPIDHSLPIPRHPVQLYEALAYLITFVILYCLSERKNFFFRQGMLTGLFFILVFGFRLILEFFKNPQSLIINESSFQMGQYLSIPFILVGCLLFWRSIRIGSLKSKKEPFCHPLLPKN